MVFSKVDIILPQWFTGIGVCLFMVQTGFMSGWASPSLVKLTEPNSPILLDPEQASWVGSLLNVGRVVGSILGPVAGNYFGSKKAILMTLVLSTVGWLTTALANAVVWLYVARILNGIAFGMAFSIYPLYVGEVAMTEIRGALVSIASGGGPMGQIVVSILGPIISIGTSASIYSACCILLMVLFCFLPESPHYLVKIGKMVEARKSINWYRAGRGVDIELKAVQEFVTASDTESFMDKLKQFGTPSVRFATLQVMALYSFGQICGANSVSFYLEMMLIRARFTIFNPSNAAIYVSIASLVGSIVSVFLIDKCGRRFLFIASSIGVCISMIIISTYFFLMNDNVNVQNLQWLLIFAVLFFAFSYCIGFLTVPGTVLSELFPSSIKCAASSIASLTGGLMAFASSKSYQPMVDVMDESWVFLTYAIFATLVLPYVLIFMPETKGKSLLEIQNEFMKK